MWTLFVISTIVGLEEPKVTRYAEYATAIDCVQDWVEISREFTQSEYAFCEGPK